MFWLFIFCFCMLSDIEFSFQEMPMGGSALDLVGVPSAAKQSDVALLGAIGGYLWFDYVFLFFF